jgi:hypothetical protein
VLSGDVAMDKTECDFRLTISQFEGVLPRHPAVSAVKIPSWTLRSVIASGGDCQLLVVSWVSLSCARVSRPRTLDDRRSPHFS